MLVIDKFSRSPIYEQLTEGIESDITSGRLPPGAKLPSVRELSVSLCVNPNTVQKALAELDRAGVIVSSQGVGSFVAPDAVEKIRARIKPRLSEFEELVRRLINAGADENELKNALQSAIASAKRNREGNK